MIRSSLIAVIALLRLLLLLLLGSHHGLGGWGGSVSLRDVGLVAGETQPAERCSSFSSAGRTPPSPARPSVRGLPRGLSPTHSAVLEAGGKLERGALNERTARRQTTSNINFLIQMSILSSKLYFIPIGFHS